MSFNISKKAYDAVMSSTRQGVEVSYQLADEPTVDNTPLDILSGEDGQADELSLIHICYLAKYP